jgi:hypothetical protein
MKDILTSPRIEDMKRKARARRIRLAMLLFILLLSLIYAIGYFSSNPRITINKIVVTGTRIINSPDVEDIVNKNISGKYLRLFDKKNIFIYPKKQIYNDLIKNFTRIDKLSIYRDNLNTLHIDISERSGTSLYCGSSVPEIESEVGENCYFVNDNGYIFDKAPYFSGNIYFKYYAPIEEGVDPMGQQILPKEVFQSYVRFIEEIAKLKFKPNYLVIEKDGTSTLYLDHEPSATAPKIIFKNDADLEKILENLSLSISKDSFASEIYSKYTTLLYIDMRFKNKVLYKFQ